MKTTFLTSLILASIAFAPAASALTVINRDTEDHQVLINESGDEQVYVLAPEETLTDVCTAGCTIAADEEDPMEVDGNGTVAIVGGRLVREQ